ncbi:MAG: nucleoside 2-deoxyribosyltransferase [Thermofilaceae archaeon]
MKIYLAAPIRGVRKALPTVKRLADVITGSGCELLTPQVVDETVDVDRGLKPEEVYERDVQLLEEADMLVAEISYPSLGVGFEIAYGLLKGKYVIAMCEEERVNFTSVLIRGIKNPCFRLIIYSSSDDAAKKLQAELRSMTVTN